MKMLTFVKNRKWEILVSLSIGGLYLMGIALGWGLLSQKMNQPSISFWWEVAGIIVVIFNVVKWIRHCVEVNDNDPGYVAYAVFLGLMLFNFVTPAINIIHSPVGDMSTGFVFLFYLGLIGCFFILVCLAASGLSLALVFILTTALGVCTVNRTVYILALVVLAMWTIYHFARITTDLITPKIKQPGD